jgi:hypothetical protein
MISRMANSSPVSPGVSYVWHSPAGKVLGGSNRTVTLLCSNIFFAKDDPHLPRLLSTRYCKLVPLVCHAETLDIFRFSCQKMHFEGSASKLLKPE